MRVTVFAAVVAAHIALVWYFLTLWHVAAASEDADEPSMTLVFLPPLEQATPVQQPSGSAPATPAANRDDWRAPQQYRNAPGVLRQPAVASSASPEGSAQPNQSAEQFVTQPGMASVATADTPEPGVSPSVDWHTQAEIIAQADAQHIVESEDRAARQAGALTAMTKAHHQGPHNPVIPFGWDPNPRYRWQPAQGGGFTMALNDHCQVFVLIMVFVGCTVGELPPARGDLFKNMHPPVKFGDWDWRLDDP